LETSVSSVLVRPPKWFRETESLGHSTTITQIRNTERMGESLVSRHPEAKLVSQRRGRGRLWLDRGRHQSIQIWRLPSRSDRWRLLWREV